MPSVGLYEWKITIVQPMLAFMFKNVLKSSASAQKLDVLSYKKVILSSKQIGNPRKTK